MKSHLTVYILANYGENSAKKGQDSENNTYTSAAEYYNYAEATS